MNALLEVVLSLLAVDFVSGLVHWAEDTFGTEATPLVGAWIVAPNALHHEDGAAFTGKSWLASSWDLALAAGLLVAAAVAGGWFGPGVAIFVLAGANANQVHKWCHAPARAPRLVHAAWRLRLLQGPRHHARHHAGAKNEAYCVVTPYLNPLLDALGFWRALERRIVPWTGATRRADLGSPRGRLARARRGVAVSAQAPTAGRPRASTPGSWRARRSGPSPLSRRSSGGARSALRGAPSLGRRPRERKQRIDIATRCSSARRRTVSRGGTASP